MSGWGTAPEWIQTVIAGLGLWGLYSYTRYTKDIRNATLATQRATIEPLLVCSFAEFHEGLPVFNVTNEGNGMALDVKAATIFEPLAVDSFFDISKAVTTPLGNLKPGSPPKQYRSLSAEKAMGDTIIIQAEDVNGDSHQLNLAVFASRVHGLGARTAKQARVSDRKHGPVPHKQRVVTDSNGRNIVSYFADDH